MDYIKINDNEKFVVANIIGYEDFIKFTFSEKQDEILTYFKNTENVQAIEKISIFTELDELQGEHFNYNQVMSILIDENGTTITLKQEDKVTTELKSIKQELIDSNIYITDLELRLFELELANAK